MMKKGGKSKNWWQINRRKFSLLSYCSKTFCNNISGTVINRRGKCAKMLRCSNAPLQQAYVQKKAIINLTQQQVNGGHDHDLLYTVHEKVNYSVFTYGMIHFWVLFVSFLALFVFFSESFLFLFVFGMFQLLSVFMLLIHLITFKFLLTLLIQVLQIISCLTENRKRLANAIIRTIQDSHSIQILHSQ